MSMKKVLIPLGVIPWPDNCDALMDVIRQSVIDKMNQYNLLPLLVSPTLEKEAIDILYEQADGVFFFGGSDINPHQYNQDSHEKTQALEPTRDSLEISIMRRVLKDNKPFMGVCRGAQIMSIAAGGTLHQDVITLAPEECHGGSNGETYQDILANKHHHSILVNETSKAYKVLGKTTVRVNSGHHQSIEVPGEGIRIAAKSPEGVVEITEAIDPKHFCFGLQCHPEAEKNGSLEPFFPAFVQAMA